MALRSWVPIGAECHRDRQPDDRRAISQIEPEAAPPDPPYETGKAGDRGRDVEQEPARDGRADRHQDRHAGHLGEAVDRDAEALGEEIAPPAQDLEQDEVDAVERDVERCDPKQEAAVLRDVEELGEPARAGQEGREDRDVDQQDQGQAAGLEPGLEHAALGDQPGHRLGDAEPADQLDREQHRVDDAVDPVVGRAEGARQDHRDHVAGRGEQQQGGRHQGRAAHGLPGQGWHGSGGFRHLLALDPADCSRSGRGWRGRSDADPALPGATSRRSAVAGLRSPDCLAEADAQPLDRPVAAPPTRPTHRSWSLRPPRPVNSHF